jgi:Concanavalin A-like lectin/glucanases superfamily
MDRVMSLAALTAFLCALLLPGRIVAQGPNRVLQLDGDDSYVQLPPNIFNHLTNATIEGWVKWDRLGNWMRFFDFGRANQTMVIGNKGMSSTLAFELFDAKGQRQGDVDVPDVLVAGQWFHIAVVTGKGGVRIYVNGALRATNPYTGSFAQIGDGSRNFLGRNNWKETSPDVNELQGQMDEVRIWNNPRTAEQIRANLFRTLTGKEEGLVGYWNFDDGNAKDLSSGHHDGELVGNVKFPTSTREHEYQLLTGKVLGPDQKPVADADIRLLSGEEVVASSRTDADGSYYCLLTKPAAGACDVQAVKDELTGWRFALNLLRNGRAEANFQLSDASTVKDRSGSRVMMGWPVSTGRAGARLPPGMG